MSTSSATLTKLIQSFRATFFGTRRAIEDVVISMIPQGVSVVCGFLTSVLVARGLGPSEMGRYALILSVSGLAAALSDLGIGQTAIRFASQAAEKGDSETQLAVLRWAFRLRMLMVFAISFAVFVAAPLIADQIWHDVSLVRLVRISLLIGIFAAVAAIPTIYYQSLKRFRMNAIASVGQTISAFAGIVLIAAARSWSIENVILVSVVAGGVGAIILISLVPKASLLRLRDFRLPVRKLSAAIVHAPHVETASTMDRTGANSFAVFMVISSVLVSVTLRADVWLMGFYLPKSDVGLYSVATRFTLPLVIVLGALNTALWPRASALTDIAKTLEMVRKTFRISVLVTAGAAIYSILTPLAMPYIFGSTYEKGILVAQILCLRYCLSLLICPLGVIGYSFGLVRVYWVINLLQLIAVVLANVLFLPRLGAVGAALALIVNEVIGFGLCGFVIRRKILEMKSSQRLGTA